MPAEALWRQYERASASRLASSPCSIAAHSAIMRDLSDQLTAIGEDDSPVLIVGESGVAKGCFAERVHRASRRRDTRLARLPAVSVTRSTFEALFGAPDAIGTLTSMHAAAALEASRGGALFFEEVGALPADMQEALMQLLTVGELDRRGSAASIVIDARIMASSSIDLVEAVNEGRFREDLYYRLSATSISVPPVRARGEADIIHLLDHVTRTLGLELHGSPSRLSPVALQRLVQYPWPGNIREMKNALERAMLSARGHDEIALPHLPPEVRDPMGFDGEYVPHTLAELERLHIERTLRRHRQNRTHAANELGISRATLIKKVREYGLAGGTDRVRNAEKERVQ